jgi:F0F1-type ATP synthase gamma subunit
VIFFFKFLADLLIFIPTEIMQDARRNCEFRLVIAGNKGSSAMRREFVKQFVITVGDLTKKPVSFIDMEPLINAINNEKDFDRVRIVSNTWNSVVSTEISQRTIAHPSKLAAEVSPSIGKF